MGWTTVLPEYFTKKGDIDRKAECDAYFEEGANSGHFRVLKSSMVGSTYYAAVKDMDRYTGKDNDGNDIYEPTEKGRTWGAVMLTSAGNGEFSYKMMKETEGPFSYDCPKCILNLLDDTDDKNALDWRKGCLIKAEDKKKLESLPIGAMIQFTSTDRKTYRLIKHEPDHQFRTPFWMDENGRGFIPKNIILDCGNWKVIK